MSAPDPGVGAGLLERAQGCLLGQFAGDALGGMVEFGGSLRCYLLQWRRIGGTKRLKARSVGNGKAARGT